MVVIPASASGARKYGLSHQRGTWPQSLHVVAVLRSNCQIEDLHVQYICVKPNDQAIIVCSASQETPLFARMSNFHKAWFVHNSGLYPTQLLCGTFFVVVALPLKFRDSILIEGLAKCAYGVPDRDVFRLRC